MKVFLFSKILEIAKLPINIKDAIIDEAYNENTADGMKLEAAVNLMKIAGARRGVTYDVPISTFEKLRVEACGKFIFVHDF